MRILTFTLFFFPVAFTHGLEPIPDKLVVLTFDDSCKSHFTVARPLLKKLGFNATFFITEGFDFPTNRKDYMSWQEIVQLHQDGFEIGNHTKDHMGVNAKNLSRLPEQVRAINARCKEFGIGQPVSFAYPGNAIVKEALPILKDLGFKFARRGGAPEVPYKEGGGFPYQPGLDHPLLIPTTGDARPSWKLPDFIKAVSNARHGKIAILQFHGVPDTAHEWVNTPQENFEQFMRYLADNHFTVISLKDLEKYTNPANSPGDPWGVINDRMAWLEKKKQPQEGRKPLSPEDETRWLAISKTHDFSHWEAAAALDLDASAIEKKYSLVSPVKKGNVLLALPYPGGRHPRSGFLEGAIRPQRETKISIFPPWANGGYAVADLPEAIWFEPNGKRELLYLAHTHIPTYWDKKGVDLSPREWEEAAGGVWISSRTLPNGVFITTRVTPMPDQVRLQFTLHNGSKEMLSGLRMQMCVMLKELSGFALNENGNKLFRSPFAACVDQSGKKWVISWWENCQRAWGNPPCPCLHSDPAFHDCAPGKTVTVQGGISFFEGVGIEKEMERIIEKMKEK